MRDGADSERSGAARRFPRQIWNQLSAIDTRLLDAIAFLAKLQARNSSSGAYYCTPGRRWLANHLGCSVETITRHTTKLRALGVLHKIQRRPIAGKWQTCLYSIIHPHGWRAAQLRRKITAVAYRLSKVTALVSSKGRLDNPPASREALSDVLARGRARFCPT